LQRISIVQWQQTSQQYVAVLQAQSRFKPDTIKRHQLERFATVVEGELLDGGGRDWYCVALPREEMEFDEARSRAGAIVEKENQLRAAGKTSLAGK